MEKTWLRWWMKHFCCWPCSAAWARECDEWSLDMSWGKVEHYCVLLGGWHLEMRHVGPRTKVGFFFLEKNTTNLLWLLFLLQSSPIILPCSHVDNFPTRHRCIPLLESTQSHHVITHQPKKFFFFLRSNPQPRTNLISTLHNEHLTPPHTQYTPGVHQYTILPIQYTPKSTPINKQTSICKKKKVI